MYCRDVVGYCHLRLISRCRHPAPGQDLIPLQMLHVFAHSRDPHPAIKLWCQVPFTKSKTIFQIEMYCMQCFLNSKYIKSRIFNDKNRRIIKEVMILKKLIPHLATRSTYSPGDRRCDEAWREQTLVYPPVMCQQGLIYCTCELNVMSWMPLCVRKTPWWRNQMETLSALLALCVGIHRSSVTVTSKWARWRLKITRASSVCSTVCSAADRRKYLTPAPLACMRGIHRSPVDSPQKGPVTRKMFPFHDVIMELNRGRGLMGGWCRLL